jgi:hypothetical protein
VGGDVELVAFALEVDAPADGRAFEDGSVAALLAAVAVGRPGRVVDDEDRATGGVGDGFQGNDDEGGVLFFEADAGGDDNPDIEDFIGYGELLDAYRTSATARVRQAALDAAVRQAEIALEFASGWEIR